MFGFKEINEVRETRKKKQSKKSFEIPNFSENEDMTLTESDFEIPDFAANEAVANMPRIDADTDMSLVPSDFV